MSRRVLGHQLSMFGPEVPIYGRPTRTSRQSAPRVTPPEDDFITVYHASTSHKPPHAVEHDHTRINGVPRSQWATNKENHIFVGDLPTATAFSGRRYMHAYKVPKSAIYPVEYSDDMDVDEEKPGYPSLMNEPRWAHHGRYASKNTLSKHPPQAGLWSMFAASPYSPEKTESVIPYRNAFEGTRLIHEDGGARYEGPISYILPKGKVFDKLGIQYLGLTNERTTMDGINYTVDTPIDYTRDDPDQ